MAKKLVVFISYARVDVEIAYQITEVLERGGHTPWIDHQLIPGQRWQEKIEEAIRESDVFLLMLSSNHMYLTIKSFYYSSMVKNMY